MNNLNTSVEVESATLHRTENRLLDDHTHDGGMKDKLYHLRSRGIERLNTWKPRVKGQIASLQGQMKSNPGKWAGIAAGAGLGIGLLGRMMRRRSHMRSEEIPNIVIVGGC